MRTSLSRPVADAPRPAEAPGAFPAVRRFGVSANETDAPVRVQARAQIGTAIAGALCAAAAFLGRALLAVADAADVALRLFDAGVEFAFGLVKAALLLAVAAAMLWLAYVLLAYV